MITFRLLNKIQDHDNIRHKGCKAHSNYLFQSQ